MGKICLTLRKGDSIYKKVIDIPEKAIKIDLSYGDGEIYELTFKEEPFKDGDYVTVINSIKGEPFLIIGKFKRVLSLKSYSLGLFHFILDDGKISRGSILTLKNDYMSSRRSTPEEIEMYEEAFKSSVLYLSSYNNPFLMKEIIITLVDGSTINIEIEDEILGFDIVE